MGRAMCPWLVYSSARAQLKQVVGGSLHADIMLDQQGHELLAVHQAHGHSIRTCGLLTCPATEVAGRDKELTVASGVLPSLCQNSAASIRRVSSLTWSG